MKKEETVMRAKLKTVAVAMLFTSLAVIGSQFEIAGEALYAQDNVPEKLSTPIVAPTPTPTMVGNRLRQHRQAMDGSGGGSGDGMTNKRISIFANARSEDVEDTNQGVEADLEGLIVGADMLLNNNQAIGGFLDLSSTDSNTGAVFDEDVDELAVGAFFIWFEEAFDAQLSGRIGSQDISNRRVTTSGGVASGDLDGSVFDLNAAFNYYLRQPDQTMPGITLVSSLSYYETDRDSYTETGSSRNLRVSDLTIESLIGDAGVEIYKPISTSWGVFSPLASFKWRHEFEDDPIVLTAVSADGNPFVRPSAATSGPIDANWYEVSLGFTFVGAHGWSGFFDVDFDIDRDNVDSTTYTLGFRKELGNPAQ
jgi:outer membrane autotransporter protein